MQYKDLILKQPIESPSYKDDSDFVVTKINEILKIKLQMAITK